MKRTYVFVSGLFVAVLMVFGIGISTASAQSADDVTINVMKHVCDVSIQSASELNDVDVNNDGVTEFTDKIITCPTVVLRTDDYDTGTLHFSPKLDFDFRVTGGDGEEQEIENATLINQRICEAEEPSNPDSNTTYLGEDVDDDGDLDTCLDTSLYSYTNVSAGNISIRETDSPTGKAGGALAFTPASLNGGFDEGVVLSDSNRFEDGVVEIDSDDDNDGTITLHLYNFRMTDAELSAQLDVARIALLQLLALVRSQQTAPGFPNTGDGSL